MKKSILILSLLLFLACSSEVASPTAEYGFSFITPPAWSVLSQEELNELFPDTQAIFTAGNIDRSGIITVVVQEVPEDQASAFKNGLGYFVGQIEASAQKRYYDYQLHEQGQTDICGKDAWELIYEGTLPSESHKWRRLVTFVSPVKDNALIFVGFSCPINDVSDFESAFAYVERSWQWLE